MLSCAAILLSLAILLLLGIAAVDESAFDFDVTITVDALEQPLGINVGAGLQVLGFAEGSDGSLPWIASKGGVVAGDRIVGLNGEYVEWGSLKQLQSSIKTSKQESHHLVLRIRPKDGRHREAPNMYSPRSLSEAVNAESPWHLDLMLGPIAVESVKVTKAHFGGEPRDCNSAKIVWAHPDGACEGIAPGNCRQMRGGLAIVRRGGCSFAAKAQAVASCGAAALVVIDTGAGDLQMEDGHGQEVAPLDLPAVMVSSGVGQRLKVIERESPLQLLKGRLVTSRACLDDEQRFHSLHSLGEEVSEAAQELRAAEEDGISRARNLVMSSLSRSGPSSTDRSSRSAGEFFSMTSSTRSGSLAFYLQGPDMSPLMAEFVLLGGQVRELPVDHPLSFATMDGCEPGTIPFVGGGLALLSPWCSLDTGAMAALQVGAVAAVYRVPVGESIGRFQAKTPPRAQIPVLLLAADDFDDVMQALQPHSLYPTAAWVMLKSSDAVEGLWKEVSWLLDESNWPKVRKQWRRVYFRYRNSHSPDHADSGSRSRWALVQNAFDAMRDVDDEL